MTEKLTMDDLLGAVEWEGGIGELIEHGIDIDEYDVSDEFRSKWNKAEKAYLKFASHADWLNEELYSYDGDE